MFLYLYFDLFSDSCSVLYTFLFSCVVFYCLHFLLTVLIICFMSSFVMFFWLLCFAFCLDFMEKKYHGGYSYVSNNHILIVEP